MDEITKLSAWATFLTFLRDVGSWLLKHVARVWGRIQAEHASPDSRLAFQNLATYFRHTADFGSVLWLTHDGRSFYKTYEAYTKAPEQIMNPQIFFVMASWWFGTLKPDLEEAARSGREEALMKVLNRVIAFNCAIHDVWGPVIKKMRGDPATEKALVVYDQTFGKIHESVELLGSMGRKIDWRRASKLGLD